jgi:dsDNA-specific endonuclease/ATPase MutS2
VVRVRTDEGFELDRAEHGLVLVNSELRTRLSQVSDHQAKLIAANDTLEEKRKKQKGARPGKTPKKAEDNSVAEVDLHLHELVDDERNLSDGEKLEFQLRYFERALEGAIRDGKRKLIVIHGVGEGVLREEVRRMLQYYDTVQFQDADMRRFGAGATEVIIHRTR